MIDSSLHHFNRNSFDVVIVSRYAHFWLQHAPDSQQRYIWAHDTELLPWWNSHQLPLMPYLKNLAPIISGFIGLTSWHTSYLHATYPFISNDRWKTVGNGIHAEFFTDAENDASIVRRPHRMIWSSAPERGLERVLRMVTILKQKFDDLELHIFAHGDSKLDKQVVILLPVINIYLTGFPS
jgi:hypothetical protein